MNLSTQPRRADGPFDTSHGGSYTKLYRTWVRMRSRCSGSHGSEYYSGTAVCDEWRNDFAAFRTWALTNGYREGLTIDRWPDKDGDYEPSNCRWATMKEQANNRRRRRWWKKP